jgi:hypothetical protein
VQFESWSFQVLRHPVLDLVEKIPTIIKTGKIIDVPQIIQAPQLLLDKVVKAVQVEVREELTRQISYRNSFSPGVGSPEVIVGKVMIDRFLLITGVDDRIDQPENVRIGYFLADDLLEKRVVDGGKVFRDITLEHESTLTTELLTAVDPFMSSFPFSVGIIIYNEGRLKDRLYNVYQGMMDHSITIRRAADVAFLAFVINPERGVASWLVGMLL